MNPTVTDDISVKAKLLRRLEENRSQLRAALDGLTEDEISNLPAVGDWTIKDTVGHISYWEQRIHDFVTQTFTEGKPHKLTEADSNQDLNEREAAKRKKWSWTRVRAEFENTRQALIQRVNDLSAANLEFQIPSPWWNEERFITVARLINGANIHCREHIEEIEKWKSARQTP
jgi:hypothetical protein